MPGGLLNIIAYGNQNVFLHGNPDKTFFKSVYAKHTNFGIQKFRVDYNGSRTLRLNEKSTFTFKIPRYAELLLDTFLAIQLPDIWSPIYPPQSLTDEWSPYEFKWIENLGVNMIEEITISIGGQIIQKYSGQYIYNMYLRDFRNKNKLFSEMTGNISELNDPANAFDRSDTYPSAYYNTTSDGAEPSIRSRMLYIPLCPFFSFNTNLAFPLTCLQYSELNFNVTLRPIKELFTIKDITNYTEGTYDRIQPNFNISEHAFYRFLQQPPSIALNADDYEDQTTIWNADIHLMCNYCFLTEEETKVFAKNEQLYLIKEIKETTHKNLVGSNKISLETSGMVKNWMWFFRRNDAYTRNEWSNYSNFPYKGVLPYDIETPTDDKYDTTASDATLDAYLSAGPYKDSGVYLSGDYHSENIKNILQKFSIVFDGKYRENEFDGDIYNYIEKYKASNCLIENGLYCYNFCFNTNPYDNQPSGSINLNKFRNIEFEFTTTTPEVNNDAEFLNICTEDGELIGVNKNTWDTYKYNYDLIIQEERYNILKFISGTASLFYSS